MRLRPFLALFIVLIAPVAHAQTTPANPCGMVDAIDLPLDNISEDYDDFGLYRPNFGGNHTGLDIGFGRWGDPVHAAARGLVTLSNVEEWGTEKGVVVLEHTFPDGSIFYTVYGHMEQTDTISFPKLGACVQKGDVVGAVGWPSRGKPHLHFEVRDFLPNEGGPGYVSGNPLDEGWYHPLDFVNLWRARLSPAFISDVQFSRVPMLPPVTLDSGMIVIANGNLIEGVLPPKTVEWRIETDGIVTGLAALPAHRVVAHTHNGQVVVLQDGRYMALWTVDGLDEPFVALGETLVFLTSDGGLAAYDPSGKPLWTVSGATPNIDQFASNGTTIVLAATGKDGTNWWLFDSSGKKIYETHFGSTPAMVSQPGGGWLVLDETQLWRVAGGKQTLLASLPLSAERNARLAADPQGNIYLYMNDVDKTLMALDPTGQMRWRVRYASYPPPILPPLVRVGNGCLLYTLDLDGTLNVINTADGALLNQMHLYAGGDESGNPRARLLNVDSEERVQMVSGFLTFVTFDGWKLGGDAVAACRNQT